MTEQKQTIKDLEKRIESGDFGMVDLGFLQLKDPKTAVEVRGKVYAREFTHSIEGISSNLTRQYPSISSAISCLNYAERLYLEAKDNDVELPISDLKSAFDNLADSAKSDFKICSAILQYMPQAKMDFIKSRKDELNQRYKCMVPDEMTSILKQAKKHAKRAYNSKSMRCLRDAISKLNSLQESSGMEVNQAEIDAIKQTAYRKGVEFYNNLAKQHLSGSERANGLLEKSRTNADKLNQIFMGG